MQKYSALAFCLVALLSPFTVIPVSACFKRLDYHGQFPLLYIDACTNNFQLGMLVGETFSTAIKHRMETSIAFQKVKEYCRTNWGHQLLESLKQLHHETFPAYYQELAGMAAGSEVPFDELFMLNLRQEILAAGEAPEPDNDPYADPNREDACSDVLLNLRPDPHHPPTLYLGHNEDMTNDTLGQGHVYFIRANMGRHSWFAFTYAGELPSTAFAATSAGVAFTLNALYPSTCLLPGLGRNFLSRRLLDAEDFGEAMDVLQMEGQATGRSVNLIDVNTPQMYNVEVGPNSTYNVFILADNSWYFHANSYLRLPQPQKIDNSSEHRQARASQYGMPSGQKDVLTILGDTQDPDFPIFRTGDYGGLVYTLCTVMFDLPNLEMLVYSGNPDNGNLASVLNLDTLRPKMFKESREGQIARGQQGLGQAGLRGQAGWKGQSRAGMHGGLEGHGMLRQHRR